MIINYVLTEGLELQRNGAMIDLVASKSINVSSITNELVDLGISMQLPNYIMAIVPPRSGLYGALGLIMVNSFGVIDSPNPKNRTNIYIGDKEKFENGYTGNGDKWKANLISLKETVYIKKGNRLVQFHLTPTMDCPWYIWLKWIFKRKLIFNRVDVLLSNKNRGGFNSTGLK
jgi:dUTPase